MLEVGGELADFGPDAARPCLVIEVSKDDHSLLAEMSPWLKSLPCPVVAIAAADSDALAACDVVLRDAADLGAIVRTATATPLAAMTFVQTLRLIEGLAPEAALTAESLAYGVLQAGPEFRSWLDRRTPPGARAEEAGPAVEIDHRGDRLDLRLNRPVNRNAISTEIRDELVAALDLAFFDDGIRSVTLSGAGKCFSVGGDLTEFGLASDPATAHWIRSVRSPARALLRCAHRLEARVHGACIGSGIELPAFANRLSARANSFFQLPELGMGLIPGAGGCVSLSRRIGRQRTALLGLTGKRINAPTAQAWGLVDEILG